MKSAQSYSRGSLGFHYEISESGEREWIVLCHALASDLQLWDKQVTALKATYNVLRFDLPGHGHTPIYEDGDYSFERIANELVDLLSDLKISTPALLGISIGGEVAQVAASLYPRYFSKLILVSTACYTDPARKDVWDRRIDEVKLVGMSGIASSTAARWFSEKYAKENVEDIEVCKRKISATQVSSYIGLAQTIKRMDLRPALAAISAPTLVICGDQDHNTGNKAALQIASHISDAEVVTVNGAGHFPNLEMPSVFNKIVLGFLEK